MIKRRISGCWWYLSVPYEYLSLCYFSLPGFLLLVFQVRNPDSFLSVTTHIYWSPYTLGSALEMSLISTLLPCCPCLGAAFNHLSPRPAFRCWSLFKPNLRISPRIHLPKTTNKTLQKAECFPHFHAWKCSVKKHLCFFAKPQTGLLRACLFHLVGVYSCVPSAATTVPTRLFLKHALPLLNSVSIEIYLLDGSLPPSLPGKQLLIFQCSSNVTSSTQSSWAEDDDCGIYHSVWCSSVFISVSLTGL